MQLYAAKLRFPMTRENYQAIGITSVFNVSGKPMDKGNANFYPRKITLTIDQNGGAGWEVDAVNILLPGGSP